MLLPQITENNLERGINVGHFNLRDESPDFVADVALRQVIWPTSARSYCG